MQKVKSDPWYNFIGARYEALKKAVFYTYEIQARF